MKKNKNTWIVIDSRETCGSISLLNKSDTTEIITHEEFIENVSSIPRREDKICLTSEQILPHLMERTNDETLNETIELFKNKYAFRSFLSHYYPDFFFIKMKTTELGTFHPEKGKNYFVKPIKGYWSTATHKIDNHTNLTLLQHAIESELTQHTPFFNQKIISQEEILIEEYCYGEEYAVDMYYNNAGEATILSIAHHPMPEENGKRPLFYYTSQEIIKELYSPIHNFFKNINQKLQISKFPIHAEFKYYKGKLIPIEFNPLRFGSDGFYDLIYHAFNISPFECFVHDRSPRLDLIFTKQHKNTIFGYYAGTDVYRTAMVKNQEIDQFHNDELPTNATSVTYITFPSKRKMKQALHSNFKKYFIEEAEEKRQITEKLSRIGIRTLIKREQPIFNNNEYLSKIIYIISGEVTCYGVIAAYKKIITWQMTPGSFIDTSFFFAPELGYLTLWAKTPLIIIKIDYELFMQSLDYMPEVSYSFFRQQKNELKTILNQGEKR